MPSACTNHTIRRARRERQRGFVWRSTLDPSNIKDRSFKGPIALNRSKRWRRAETYAEARAQHA